MKTRAAADELAESIHRVGTANGLKVVTMLTAMDAPLGRAVGNSLEVIESLVTLRGEGPTDLTELCVRQAIAMLALAGVEKADTEVRAALSNRTALVKFRQMVRQQGGDPRVVDDPSLLPAAPDRAVVSANASGYVESMDAAAVGLAAMALGAGRERAEEIVDPAVGVIVHKKPGEAVQIGEPVFEIHHRAGKGLPKAMALLQEAYTVADTALKSSPVVLEVRM